MTLCRGEAGRCIFVASYDLGARMNLVSSRITFEPDKCGGRPCIRGLRIRVTDILSLLGAGASFQEILEDYPDLEADDILAALNFAAAQIDRTGLGAD